MWRAAQSVLAGSGYRGKSCHNAGRCASANREGAHYFLRLVVITSALVMVGGRAVAEPHRLLQDRNNTLLIMLQRCGISAPASLETLWRASSYHLAMTAEVNSVAILAWMHLLTVLQRAKCDERTPPPRSSSTRTESSCLVTNSVTACRP